MHVTHATGPGVAPLGGETGGPWRSGRTRGIEEGSDEAFMVFMVVLVEFVCLVSFSNF